MATKIKPCTVAPKHKWEWSMDLTRRSISMGLRGTSVKLSRRGLYKCACGQEKEGQPRSGL